MRYSYDDIKKFHDETKGLSITTMAIKLLETFPTLTQDVPYRQAHIEGCPEEIPFSDIGIHQKVLNVAVSNLAAFLLTSDIVNVTRIPVKWAQDHGDKDSKTFFQHLAKWIKGEDYRSVVNLVYLAHYETEFRKHRRMDSGNIVLPGKDQCEVIVQLANTLMKAMKEAKVLTHRVDAYCGYNEVVDKGDIDFLVGDTLYISRLGRVYSRDRYYLLICYVLMKHSLKYKEVPINHVCIVSPSDSVSYRVDIRQVPSDILSVVNDCIYGPTERLTVETVLSRKRRVTLTMTLVSLFDAKDHDSVLYTITQTCTTYLPASNLAMKNERIKQSFDAAVDYFSVPAPKEMEEEHYYYNGVNLLNQLLSDFENVEQKELKTVQLSSELTKDILNKALDF